MTCIVGLVERKTVYIGGDSAGTSNWFDQTRVKHPKVFVSQADIDDMPVAIGYSGVFRDGQIVEHCMRPPFFPTGSNAYAWMVREFVPHLRDTLRAEGAIPDNKAAASTMNTSFIVGFEGRIFEVQSDFSVLESREGATAIGMGANIALGALFTTNAKRAPAEERIRAALRASAKQNVSVAPPFHVVRV